MEKKAISIWGLNNHANKAINTASKAQSFYEKNKQKIKDAFTKLKPTPKTLKILGYSTLGTGAVVGSGYALKKYLDKRKHEKVASLLDTFRGIKSTLITSKNVSNAVSGMAKNKSKWNLIKNFKEGKKELEGLNKADKKTKIKNIYKLFENYGKTQKPIKNGLSKGLAIGVGGTAIAGYGLHKLTSKQKKEAGFFNKKTIDALATPEQLTKLQKKISFRNGLILGTGGTVGVTGGGYALKKYLDKKKEEQFLNNNQN